MPRCNGPQVPDAAALELVVGFVTQEIARAERQIYGWSARLRDTAETLESGKGGPAIAARLWELEAVMLTARLRLEMLRRELQRRRARWPDVKALHARLEAQPTEKLGHMLATACRQLSVARAQAAAQPPCADEHGTVPALLLAVNMIEGIIQARVGPANDG